MGLCLYILTFFSSFVLPPEEVGIPGQFGLLAGKNSSLGGQYTVDTGASNLKHLSQTIAYRGKRSFKAWRSQACNKARFGHKFLHALHSQIFSCSTYSQQQSRLQDLGFFLVHFSTVECIPTVFGLSFEDMVGVQPNTIKSCQ